MAGVTARLEGVVKRYGHVTALDGVSILFERGKITTLLGPSGCGKTTLLKVIAGIEMPDEGRVFFDDRDVTRVPPEKRNIGFVFQDLALFPHLSVFDNVAFGLRIRRVPEHEIRARVNRMLDLVGLEPSQFANRKIGQLSGGQQQRVAIARALVIEPSLLLLDEPFSHLDYKVKQRLLHELRRIQRETRATVVYVTHDQEEAMIVSHKVAIMNRGRIVQEGRPEEVYENPANTFVAMFFGDANVIPVGHNGSRRYLVIRPENVRITSPDESPARGRVVDVVFMGAYYRVEVEARGTTIKALLPRWVRPPGVGETVGITWDESLARVVIE